MSDRTQITLEKWKALSKEERENIQIDICKYMDAMAKQFAENDLLAFALHDDIKEMYYSSKPMAILFKLLKRMSDEKK